MRPLWVSPAILRIVLRIVGVIMQAAGILKFAADEDEMSGIPESAIKTLGLVEVIVGTWLVMWRINRAALWATCALSCMLLAGRAVLFREGSGSCKCFGDLAVPPHVIGIVLSSACLAASILLLERATQDDLWKRFWIPRALVSVTCLLGLMVWTRFSIKCPTESIRNIVAGRYGTCVAAFIDGSCGKCLRISKDLQVDLPEETLVLVFREDDPARGSFLQAIDATRWNVLTVSGAEWWNVVSPRPPRVASVGANVVCRDVR
jgi:hypothetical protein